MSFKIVLRLLLAFLLLGLVLCSVGLEDLFGVLQNLRLDCIVILVMLSVVMIWVSCIKWQLFIRSAGYYESIGKLMRLYTMGYFFNSFLPSYIGGDVARSLQLSASLGSKKTAFAATFLERFIGLLAMSVLGVMSVIIGSNATKGLELAILIVAAGSLFLALVLFSECVGRWFFDLLIRCCGLLGMSKFSEFSRTFLEKSEVAVEFARRDPMLFVKSMAWSMVFHVLTVVNTYVAALAVGWETPDLMGLFVVVPLVLLVGMLPITPSGLGVQEGAFVFFLTRLGSTNAEGLAVGVVLRAKVILIAIIGGLLWASVKKKLSTSDGQDSDDRSNGRCECRTS